MQVLPDAVIINISPAQKELLRDPNHASYIRGMIIDAERWRRPRIPIIVIPQLVRQLRDLQAVIDKNPDYSNRRPHEVIERIILKLVDAEAAQIRAYGPSKF